MDLTPPAAAPAAAPVPSDNVSLDQLISEAVASAPAEQETVTEQPSAAETAQPEIELKAAADVEGTSKPAAEQPVAETAAEQPADDAVSVRRARSILAEANKKERDARQAVVNAEQDLVKQLLANPRNFLAKHGKSIAELIDIDLGQEHDPIAEQPKSKPEDDRIAKLEKLLLDREHREQEAKLQTIKDGIRANVAKDERFALINRSRSQETVLEFMEEYYNAHGQPIPWDKAARLVEQDLRERFGPPAAAPAAAPAKVPQRESTATSKPATGNTTLTNNEIRSAGPPDDAEPTDPDQLIKWLVAKEEKRLAAQAQ